MKPRTLPCSVSYDNRAPIITDPRSWASGFYKRTLRERQNILVEAFPEVFGRNFSETISPDMNRLSVYATPDTSSCRSPIEVDSTYNNNINNKNNKNNNNINNDDGCFNPELLEEKLTYLSTSDFPIRGLNEEIADNMVENCVG